MFLWALPTLTTNLPCLASCLLGWLVWGKVRDQAPSLKSVAPQKKQSTQYFQKTRDHCLVVSWGVFVFVIVFDFVIVLVLVLVLVLVFTHYLVCFLCLALCFSLLHSLMSLYLSLPFSCVGLKSWSCFVFCCLALDPKQ